MVVADRTPEPMNPSLQAISDEELALRSQKGSLEAFEELVYRYEARVYGFIVRCSQDEQVARDVTQDAFVRAFQALHQYHPERPFAPWLFAIARRKWIDHYRAMPRPLEAADPEEFDRNDPAELLARDEERLDLWRLARARLNADQFQALWLRYVEELDLHQIARVMRKSKTGVKVHLFRARRALGQILGRKSLAAPEKATTFHAASMNACAANVATSISLKPSDRSLLRLT